MGWIIIASTSLPATEIFDTSCPFGRERGVGIKTSLRAALKRSHAQHELRFFLVRIDRAGFLRPFISFIIGISRFIPAKRRFIPYQVPLSLAVGKLLKTAI